MIPERIFVDGEFPHVSFATTKIARASTTKLKDTDIEYHLAPQWTSVEDFDGEEGRYVVRYESDGGAVKQWFICDWCMRDDGTFFWSAVPRGTHITHVLDWQPPSPPTTEAEGGA